MSDFYIILGVAQTATTADIKRAYRRLARRYHPGINPGDRSAEVMFARIAEAYATLVDPRLRQQYDTGAARPAQSDQEDRPVFEFTEFDFSLRALGSEAATFSELFAEVLHPARPSQTGAPEAGADLHAVLTIGLLDAIRGVERQVVVTRQVACAACDGTGHKAVPESRCDRCGGTGRTRWARGHMVFSKMCAACDGTGWRRFQSCAPCAGHGRAVRTEAVAVHVPAGVTEGTGIRVPEKGHAGRNGGRTGDLYVTVHVQPHAQFRREGDNLVCTIPVAVHEAVLGGEIQVPVSDGTTVQLKIPPGTQGGQRFRVRGHGVPTLAGGRGDLFVDVQLVLPDVVDERSKALLREFVERESRK